MVENITPPVQAAVGVIGFVFGPNKGRVVDIGVVSVNVMEILSSIAEIFLGYLSKRRALKQELQRIINRLFIHLQFGNSGLNPLYFLQLSGVLLRRVLPWDVNAI